MHVGLQSLTIGCAGCGIDTGPCELYYQFCQGDRRLAARRIDLFRVKPAYVQHREQRHGDQESTATAARAHCRRRPR